MMPERASADFGPENRYSQTSAGVFPTRGPTWGKALRKTTQMTSNSAEAMAIGARNLNVPRTAVIFCAPGALVHGVTSRAIAATTAVPQTGEQGGGDSHSPRSRDVVRRLSGR